MSQPNKPRERKIGTKQPEKKPLIDPRYKNLIYTVGVILIIATFFVINNSQSEPEQGAYPPNYVPSSATGEKKAPNFELTTPEGKKVKLSDYKGKIVVIDFWATWCPPCRKGIPDLISLKKQYKDQGLEVIGISLDEEKEKVTPFMKQYGINYPVVYGDMNVVQSYGNISSIPTSFVIDKNGNIVASYVGLVDKSEYEKHIKNLLGKS